MSNVNQLLAKALSTTSEDEAMACLRMARKKGGQLESPNTHVDYNGHSAEYWYEKAALYYQKLKAQQDGLTLTQQQHLWRKYKEAEKQIAGLTVKNRELTKKLEAHTSHRWWLIPLMMIQFIFILIQFIH